MHFRSLIASLLVATAAVADVTPPRVVRYVEADATTDRDAAVVLEITVEVDGHVSEARVVESATPELDQAALDAVKRFELEPARRDGTPVAATIRYRYVFHPRPARVPVPAPAPAPAPAPPAAPVPVPDADEPEYSATAEVDAPPHTAVRRSVESKQLSRVAGVRGDAIRAVDILPGVSSAAQGDIPIIRGAGQNESQVFLDGVPVPLLFHFTGITSFFQSRLLDRVELYPGNFSTRYGRAIGGIIDAKTRRTRRDRFHAMLDLSVIDSAALVEAPLGEHVGFAAAARRSNVDFFFKSFVPEDAYSVVAAPVYWDYQAMVDAQVGSRNTLSVVGYGSRDSIELVFAKPNAEDPTIRGTVGGKTEFHRVGLRLDSQLSRDVRHTASVTVGKQDIDVDFGPLYQRLEALELYARSDWAFQLSRGVELDTGLDFFGQLANGRYVGPRPSGWDDSDPSAGESPSLMRTIRVSRDGIPIVAPAAWFELVLRPTDRVTISPGVRVDYYGNAKAASVDPRLSTRISVTPSTVLKGGVGLFSQPPEWYEVLAEVGNPALSPYRALHLGAGVEQKLGSGIEVGIEGFEKRIFDRVVGTPGGRPPYLENEGAGRILGVEVSASVRPSAGTFGYLAYTLSRSERRDRNGDWYLFDADHTHVVSAVLSQSLGKGWEVGARFRFVSGAPKTPIVAAVYDANLDLYRPVYAAVNSEREPAFHQLDLRIEKAWHISDLTLAAYLEVLNAYNAKNPQGTRYSYDYSKQERVNGLPILPNIGVRGEL